jgi:hypothetical protein
MKAIHPEANLMLQGYEANVHFWANWPGERKVGTDWNDHDSLFPPTDWSDFRRQVDDAIEALRR